MVRKVGASSRKPAKAAAVVTLDSRTVDLPRSSNRVPAGLEPKRRRAKPQPPPGRAPGRRGGAPRHASSESAAPAEPAPLALALAGTAPPRARRPARQALGALARRPATADPGQPTHASSGEGDSLSSKLTRELSLSLPAPGGAGAGGLGGGLSHGSSESSFGPGSLHQGSSLALSRRTPFESPLGHRPWAPAPVPPEKDLDDLRGAGPPAAPASYDVRSGEWHVCFDEPPVEGPAPAPATTPRPPGAPPSSARAVDARLAPRKRLRARRTSLSRAAPRLRFGRELRRYLPKGDLLRACKRGASRLAPSRRPPSAGPNTLFGDLKRRDAASPRPRADGGVAPLDGTLQDVAAKFAALKPFLDRHAHLAARAADAVAASPRRPGAAKPVRLRRRSDDENASFGGQSDELVAGRAAASNVSREAALLDGVAVLPKLGDALGAACVDPLRGWLELRCRERAAVRRGARRVARRLLRDEDAHLDGVTRAVARLKEAEAQAGKNKAAAKIQHLFFRWREGRLNHAAAPSDDSSDAATHSRRGSEASLSDGSHASLFFSSDSGSGHGDGQADVTDSSSGSANDSDDYFDEADARNADPQDPATKAAMVAAEQARLERREGGAPAPAPGDDDRSFGSASTASARRDAKQPLRKNSFALNVFHTPRDLGVAAELDVDDDGAYDDDVGYASHASTGTLATTDDDDDLSAVGGGMFHHASTKDLRDDDDDTTASPAKSRRSRRGRKSRDAPQSPPGTAGSHPRPESRGVDELGRPCTLEEEKEWRYEKKFGRGYARRDRVLARAAAANAALLLGVRDAAARLFRVAESCRAHGRRSVAARALRQGMNRWRERRPVTRAPSTSRASRRRGGRRVGAARPTRRPSAAPASVVEGDAPRRSNRSRPRRGVAGRRGGAAPAPADESRRRPANPIDLLAMFAAHKEEAAAQADVESRGRSSGVAAPPFRPPAPPADEAAAPVAGATRRLRAARGEPAPHAAPEFSVGRRRRRGAPGRRRGRAAGPGPAVVRRGDRARGSFAPRAGSLAGGRASVLDATRSLGWLRKRSNELIEGVGARLRAGRVRAGPGPPLGVEFRRAMRAGWCLGTPEGRDKEEIARVAGAAWTARVDEKARLAALGMLVDGDAAGVALDENRVCVEYGYSGARCCDAASVLRATVATQRGGGKASLEQAMLELVTSMLSLADAADARGAKMDELVELLNGVLAPLTASPGLGCLVLVTELVNDTRLGRVLVGPAADGSAGTAPWLDGVGEADEPGSLFTAGGRRKMPGYMRATASTSDHKVRLGRRGATNPAQLNNDDDASLVSAAMLDKDVGAGDLRSVASSAVSKTGPVANKAAADAFGSGAAPRSATLRLVPWLFGVDAAEVKRALRAVADDEDRSAVAALDEDSSESEPEIEAQDEDAARSDDASTSFSRVSTASDSSEDPEFLKSEDASGDADESTPGVAAGLALRRVQTTPFGHLRSFLRDLLDLPQVAPDADLLMPRPHMVAIAVGGFGISASGTTSSSATGCAAPTFRELYEQAVYETQSPEVDYDCFRKLVASSVDELVRKGDNDTLTVFLDKVAADDVSDLWVQEIVPARRALKRDLLGDHAPAKTPPATTNGTDTYFRDASGAYATPKVAASDDDDASFARSANSYGDEAPSPPKPWGGSPTRKGGTYRP
ncbi:hypothetical protein JL720_7774 [Aureococcus anophagefferens]|nr:hypothetical protein JL720_7774 [Aureococcus anophagefferens]